MKVAVPLLCLLSVIAATSVEKRFFANTFLNLVGMDLTELKRVLAAMALRMESDRSEQVCELQCPPAMKTYLPASWTRVAPVACPFICRSFQNLLHQLHMKMPELQPQ